MIQGTGATLYTLDEGYMSFFKEFNQTVDVDNHVTFARFFKVRSFNCYSVKYINNM